MREKDANFSNEEIQVLCCGANLGELLKEVEKNTAKIDLILKFIQDKALAGENPLVTFDDILPNAAGDTCARLLKFVGDRPEEYNPKLVNFIRDGLKKGVADLLATKKLFYKGFLSYFEGILRSCDEATSLYLHNAMGDRLDKIIQSVVGDRVKTYIEEHDKFFARERKFPSVVNDKLKILQNCLEACGISDPKNIGEKGVFEFAIQDVLDDLDKSNPALRGNYSNLREKYNALPFRELIKSDSPSAPST
jgi:hypothetical protein